MKWGLPHFDYKDDMMCILAAYKKHCSFSLYKAELMSDPKLIESVKAGKKMGYMDKIQSLSDLPEKDVLVAYIKEAESAERFFRIWTRKEALTKATAQGLDCDLRLLPGLDGVHIVDDGIIASNDDWVISSFNLNDSYTASIACNPFINGITNRLAHNRLRIRIERSPGD